MSKFYRGVMSSAAATGLSRLLGAARDVVLGNILGDSDEADAFFMAFTVPNVFRRFVADEGLTGVMVPALTDSDEGDESRESVIARQKLAGGIFTALTLAGGAITLIGMLFPEILVAAFASGYEHGSSKYELTVDLTRWMMPFVIFVSLVSWSEGLLNIKSHYFLPKLAPGIVSAALIAAALAGPAMGYSAVYALTVGLLVGGVLHFLVCVPLVRRKWGPLRLNISVWKTAPFKRALNEMGKVVAIGVFAQLNIIVLRNIASELPTGSVTHYWYANRVVDLAQGVIAVAVGSALLPAISRAAKSDDWKAFESACVDAIRLAAVVLLPAAALLLVLSQPIVYTLYKHGGFSGHGAERTAECLLYLIPFMLSVAGINIIKKPYFALNRRYILMGVAVFGLAMTFGFGWFFALHLGLEVKGLAMALSVSTALQFAVYLVLLQFKIGASIGLKSLMAPLSRMSFAAIPAAGIAFAIALLGDWSAGPTLVNVIVLGFAVFAAMIVFLAFAWLLGVRKEIKMVLRRR